MATRNSIMTGWEPGIGMNEGMAKQKVQPGMAANKMEKAGLARLLTVSHD